MPGIFIFIFHQIPSNLLDFVELLSIVRSPANLNLIPVGPAPSGLRSWPPDFGLIPLGAILIEERHSPWNAGTSFKPKSFLAHGNVCPHGGWKYIIFLSGAVSIDHNPPLMKGRRPDCQSSWLKDCWIKTIRRAQCLICFACHYRVAGSWMRSGNKSAF